MRFIKGDTLQSVIARFHSNDQPNREHQERRLALRKLLGRFIDVCNAIAYAHSRGVLHRDIKPSNVMVGKFGETLVVDWGLAKILYRADTSSPLEKSASFDPADAMEMTASGMVVGTPAYMSPEQAAGRQDLMEPASDVFSLGATLYTILTGRSPYSGKGVTDVLDCARRCDFPRPSEVSSSIHAALEAICLKAMARDPEDRYASPRALADDIERWLADAPVSAYREPLASSLARWTRRYRAAILGSAIVLLMLTMAIVVILIGFSPSQRPTTDTGRVTRPLSPEQIRQIADVIRQSDSGPRSGAGSPTTTPTPR